MIEYINGTVAELTPASAVIETAAGVGYFLNISLGTYSALKQGEHAKLYVYEAIREDAYVLYGFKDDGNAKFSSCLSRYRAWAPIRRA